ncbi:MAG TPA: amino acid adenylation domain-containing protein [Candidatus Angelobacter sp.]|nr:amino acid adenylation domain-containing protein [Candidatus Angelobacter sp.]
MADLQIQETSRSEVLTADALFRRNVAVRGEALAVQDAVQACTYRELNSRACALAHELRKRGVCAGDRVVIYSERGMHVVIAVLAVMKAQGVFVPVGLDTPAARLAFILSDANSKLLLADRAGRERLAGCDLHFQAVVIDEVASRSLDDHAPDDCGSLDTTQVQPNDLAYIIYTSGTSGEPKGVMIEHGSLARRYHDWDQPFQLSRLRPRILQIAKFGFDVFVGDLVKALCSGGVLVICPTEAVADPVQLYRWLVDGAIDYVDIVPAVLRPLVDYLELSGQNLACVGVINCGADLWTKEEYQRSWRVTKAVRLFNGYGVTECTIESTLFEDDGMLEGKNRLPIGRALDSDQILILNEDREPVAIGTTGEICIGGTCVARGYLNRPELNQKAFFVRTDSQGQHVRFYRTGDLGRIDANGVLEFLGRIDSQVKINGQRIELEEIERVLGRLPNVRQAAVCFEMNQRTLTAFIKATHGTTLNASDVTTQLRRYLPAHMIPSAIVFVPDFPLNQNGKIDRGRLANDRDRYTTHAPPNRNHELHQIRSVTEFYERLSLGGIDLISVVSEFVKPSTSFALIVIGAFAHGTASATSPVELLILLDDARAMKRRKKDLAGACVEYSMGPEDSYPRISVSLDGLKILLTFLIGKPDDENFSRKEIANLVTSDWIVQGQDAVESWVRFYRRQQIDSGDRTAP